MKEAPGFITGNELIDPGIFVLLHCFFYEYDFRLGHCISIQNFIQLVCPDQIFFQNQLIVRVIKQKLNSENNC